MNEASPSLSPEFSVLIRSGGGKTARTARAGDERDEPLRLPDRSSTALLERQEVRTKPPPLYQVLLLNDDFTPMEFVVVVLQKFFMMDLEKATQVMLRVHREGRGVCGVYTRDIAATKVELVSSFARMHQHPLQCVMEEA
jgi:ATP-dependent Clp protease adaptor protein ClpS